MILALKVSNEVGDGTEGSIGSGWVVRASDHWAWKLASHISD